MAKPVHVICGYCGSDEVMVKIGKPDPDCGCGVDFDCPNCSQINSVESFNGWQEDRIYHDKRYSELIQYKKDNEKEK